MWANKNLKQYKKTASLTKTIIKDILGLITLGVSLAFLYWIYHYSNWLPIRNFNISSQNGRLEHITVHEIDSILEPYRADMNFLSINLNEVRQKFEQKNWIDNVNVERSWPDTVNIIISERKPIAYWDSQESYLVDDKGNLFKGDINKSLVWFKGAANTEKIIFDLYQKITPLLQKHQLKLNKIEYTKRSTWILHMDEDIKIFLGREYMIKKLSLLLKVWDKLLEDGSRKIQEIHMEYRDNFSVKY